MERDDKVTELLQRVENQGMRIEVASGLLVVIRPATGDRERQRAIIAELWKYRVDVRRLAEGRAAGARAKEEFLGQLVWTQDGDAVLTDAASDGVLTISIEKEGFRHSQRLTASAASLLIILDEPAEGASAPHVDEPASEQPRKGFFERLRGSRD